MKAQYDNTPALFERLQRGILINFNITQAIDHSPSGDRTIYKCDQIKVSETPNKGEIVNSIIRTKYSSSDEFSLIHNGKDTQKHTEELDEFKAFRVTAKAIATTVLEAL